MAILIGICLFAFLQHSSEFHKRPFESAVGSIRTIAANHLWQVLMFQSIIYSVNI